MDRQKFLALESIRGLAAAIVVISHLAGAFFPVMIGSGEQPAHTRFDLLVYETPLSFFVAGNFAVVLFFVLSGFVLTYKFFARRQDTLFPAAVKRYFRLAPVALASVLFAYVLLSLNLFYSHEAGEVTGSFWYQNFYTFDYNFLGALYQGAIGIFQSSVVHEQAYNPVLWTLYYELIGSFIIFGIASFVRGRSLRWIVYALSIFALSGTYFCPFIVGMVIADLFANKRELFERLTNMRRLFRVGLLVVAVAVASYPLATARYDALSDYFQMITLIESNIPVSRLIMQMLASSIFIVLALSWRGFGRVLEHKLLLWLGKISFSFYAVHFALIYTLTAGLFLLFHGHLGYVLSAVAASLLSLPVIFGLAVLSYRYIEEPSIRLANRIGAWANAKDAA